MKLTVRVKENEPFEKALKKFVRMCKKEAEHSITFYEKPSVRRRQKQRRAHRRREREEQRAQRAIARESARARVKQQSRGAAQVVPSMNGMWRAA